MKIQINGKYSSLNIMQNVEIERGLFLLTFVEIKVGRDYNIFREVFWEA